MEEKKGQPPSFALISAYCSEAPISIEFKNFSFDENLLLEEMYQMAYETLMENVGGAMETVGDLSFSDFMNITDLTVENGMMTLNNEKSESPDDDQILTVSRERGIVEIYHQDVDGRERRYTYQVHCVP